MPTVNKQIIDLLLAQMRQYTLSSAVEIYNILEKQGLKYATLAKRIIKEDSFIGFCTNKYLQLIAKWQNGLIINNSLNADILLDGIKIAMAYEYARYIIDQYNKLHDIDNSCIIQQIPLKKIRALHSKVFAEFGLTEDVWILAIPFKIYDYLCNFKSIFNNTNY